MNKYISYKSKIVDLINTYGKKYKCELQLVDNLPANACIISFANKYIIFVSNKLEKKLLPLTIMHEYGHIYFKTIRKNPKKYNYFVELLSNLYAINKLSFMFSKLIVLKMYFLAIISEKKLYVYFIKKINIEEEKLYEELFKN